MAKISKIEVQKKNKERFNLYLTDSDGKEFFASGVDQDIILTYKLELGMEVDQLELSQIIKADNNSKALNRSIRYLGTKMRTKKEIKDYLAKHDYEKETIDHVISKLLDYKYLDDEEYARLYILDYIARGSRGPRYIANQLKLKGLDKKTIEASMPIFTEDLQIENAQAYIKKKESLRRQKSTRDFRNTISQQLVGNGYDFDIIEIAYNQYMADQSLDQEDELAAILYQGMRAHRRYQKLDASQYRLKMKTSLMQKGFSSDEIDAFLSSITRET